MTVNPKKTDRVIHGPTLFTDYDIYLFKEGNSFRLYEKMGAHFMSVDGEKGVYFAVWAPNAKKVSVIGDFNRWNPGKHPLEVRWDGSGVWEGFIPGIPKGALYKFHVTSNVRGYRVEKGDPFGFFWETAPKTASVVWDLDFEWGDSGWMKNRKNSNALDSPWSVYEMHLGSWKRARDSESRFMTYSELAPRLVEYIKDMGFTHVEFLPVMEHPFYGSWGYQVLGYYAPTSRYGTPQELMSLIDLLHRNGIGVILDWVPSHFPGDEYGLIYFDGTHLYEYGDPRKAIQPDWKSYIFNYGRNEVR
ncbi:MAG: 1,4-alpha-glucan branching enzyme, partial [Candidatus Aminicenantes bacterium]|nr:1,4-alpha-glucan branching enzyme [Candidatus Aminicenantes bacterium]